MWAAEYAETGVRVNAVAPGPTRSTGTDAMDPATLKAVADTTALGRIAEPEEIAEPVVFWPPIAPATSPVSSSK